MAVLLLASGVDELHGVGLLREERGIVAAVAHGGSERGVGVAVLRVEEAEGGRTETGFRDRAARGEFDDGQEGKRQPCPLHRVVVLHEGKTVGVAVGGLREAECAARSHLLAVDEERSLLLSRGDASRKFLGVFAFADGEEMGRRKAVEHRADAVDGERELLCVALNAAHLCGDGHGGCLVSDGLSSVGARLGVAAEAVFRQVDLFAVKFRYHAPFLIDEEKALVVVQRGARVAVGANDVVVEAHIEIVVGDVNVFDAEADAGSINRPARFVAVVACAEIDVAAVGGALSVEGEVAVGGGVADGVVPIFVFRDDPPCTFVDGDTAHHVFAVVEIHHRLYLVALTFNVVCDGLFDVARWHDAAIGSADRSDLVKPARNEFHFVGVQRERAGGEEGEQERFDGCLGKGFHKGRVRMVG